jgi:hypothetical protein
MKQAQQQPPPPPASSAATTTTAMAAAAAAAVVGSGCEGRTSSCFACCFQWRFGMEQWLPCRVLVSAIWSLFYRVIISPQN